MFVGANAAVSRGTDGSGGCLGRQTCTGRAASRAAAGKEQTTESDRASVAFSNNERNINSAGLWFSFLGFIQIIVIVVHSFSGAWQIFLPCDAVQNTVYIIIYVSRPSLRL